MSHHALIQVLLFTVTTAPDLGTPEHWDRTFEYRSGHDCPTCATNRNTGIDQNVEDRLRKKGPILYSKPIRHSMKTVEKALIRSLSLCTLYLIAVMLVYPFHVPCSFL